MEKEVLKLKNKVKETKNIEEIREEIAVIKAYCNLLVESNKRLAKGTHSLKHHLDSKVLSSPTEEVKEPKQTDNLLEF